MNDLITIDDVISKLTEETDKIFYYGSTSLFLYKKQPIKIYKVLINLNIAKIGQLLNGIDFDTNLYSDCLYQLDNNQYVLFLCKENNEQDTIKYLKKVKKELNDNGLFSFFYQPVLKKYFHIGSFYNFSKNEIPLIDMKYLEAEDIVDIAHIISELDCFPAKIINDRDEYNINVPELLHRFELIFSAYKPFNILKFFDKIGFLKILFPFLYDLKGIEQDRVFHPEGDVFDHTLYCFKYIKKPSLRLFYGLLLHDYGKLFSKQKDGFWGHSTLGSQKVKKLLIPYGFSFDFIEEVSFLVEHHMVNCYFYRLNEETKRIIFNNPAGQDLMRLFKADVLGSIGKLDLYKDISSRLKRDKKIKCFQ